MEETSPSQTCLARSHSALLDVLRQFGVEKKKDVARLSMMDHRESSFGAVYITVCLGADG